MRAGLAITQEETTRNRADNHRERKCRETDSVRNKDFKIKQDTKLWIMTIYSLILC